MEYVVEEELKARTPLLSAPDDVDHCITADTIPSHTGHCTGLTHSQMALMQWTCHQTGRDRVRRAGQSVARDQIQNGGRQRHTLFSVALSCSRVTADMPLRHSDRTSR
jgi:hypothetical protein